MQPGPVKLVPLWLWLWRFPNCFCDRCQAANIVHILHFWAYASAWRSVYANTTSKHSIKFCSCQPWLSQAQRCCIFPPPPRARPVYVHSPPPRANATQPNHQLKRCEGAPLRLDSGACDLSPAMRAVRDTRPGTESLHLALSSNQTNGIKFRFNHRTQAHFCCAMPARTHRNRTASPLSIHAFFICTNYFN